MSAAVKLADVAEPAGLAIDPENPWLGLFSYSEESRGYFHGREEETAELARRVQRKLLTVLFGQSGLGKTSLLRAGIVPRLRGEGFCPVYVRVDYAAGSPPPAEQIKQAIFRASAAAGHWTRPGTAVEGESLWEFLHHRGDLLRDAGGRTLLPLLIFDQFEEVFTLAQADEAGRRKAREFLGQLADLVENRPPALLEKVLEADEEAAQNFDFARADYRVLVALREDYLAHLEALKGDMPSITQNRMRLARMTGAQALSAILGPGGKLVSREVAESIVRFVAGGSELANAEVEPSLLSLICRELNTVRQAQGRAEISADLLAGSRETILGEFYERALADQPAAVRRVIEDELLTESGYRESLAEERVTRALHEAGAAPDALAKLVDRRLLRIEERLDLRRVELTHDVLCSVVLSSRDKRHEREARELAQRQLAEQQAREEAQHKALVRARTIAGVCAVLMVVAIAGAGFGWIGQQRARAADVAAQKARGDAEHLVAFLIEEVYGELKPTGRLETLGKLARTTIQYYEGLPPELVTPETETYRAMAMVREGEALNGQGDVDGAFARWEKAQAIFEKLMQDGHRDELVVLGLGSALSDQGQTFLGGGRGDPELLKRAIDLLEPLAQSPSSARGLKLTYADAANYYSHALPKEGGVALCRKAKSVLATMGALELKDLDAASNYADVADSEARHLASLGRMDESQKVEEEVFQLAEKVLAQRPNDLHSLNNRYFAADLLARLARRRYDMANARDYSNSAASAGEDVVRYNPGDLNSWGFWTTGESLVATMQFDRGEIVDAQATLEHLQSLGRDPRVPSSLGPIYWPDLQTLVFVRAQQGDAVGAERTIVDTLAAVAEGMATLRPDDPRRQISAGAGARLRARVAGILGKSDVALAGASAELARLDGLGIKSESPNIKRAVNNSLRGVLQTAVPAALELGRGEQAEALARRLLTVPPDPQSDTPPALEVAQGQAFLAHALVLRGQAGDAAKTLAPALAYFREQQKAGASSTFFRRDFAYALYVSALAESDGGRRKAALAEAARQVDGASEQARQIEVMRRLAGWIATARAGG
jgi:tetratricopeptide (TPR) repeat protein